MTDTVTLYETTGFARFLSKESLLLRCCWRACYRHLRRLDRRRLILDAEALRLIDRSKRPRGNKFKFRDLMQHKRA